MRVLTPMQRKFVQALYEHPRIDGCAALRLSGWTGNDMAAKRRSYVWRHHPKVLAAIQEYGRTEFQAKLPAAIHALDDILIDPTHRDHLKAALGVFDRIGMGAVTETHTTVTHKLDRGDMLQKLAGLLTKHAGAALPAPVKVIEADFQEVGENASVQGEALDLDQ